jgi:NAD(P)H dehydrogenase (quinone)
MKALIVYAHPEPKSFNGAMKDLAVETLRGRGDEVEVTDARLRNGNPRVGHRGRAEEARARRDSHSAVPDLVVWHAGHPEGMGGSSLGARLRLCRRRKYDTGMLRGKTAMIAATTGTSADTYAPDDIDGDIHTVLWPVHSGLLRYCGFDVIEPFIAHMPGRVGPEVRQRYLDDYRTRLFDIVHAPRLFFRPAQDYGRNERLRPGVIARSGVQRNV